VWQLLATAARAQQPHTQHVIHCHALTRKHTLLCCAGALTSALSWYRANTHARHFGATTPLPAAVNSLVTVPVLGVWSTRDSALLEPQMLASSRYVAPGLWQYARLEGVGHWMARDAPQQLNKLLLDFLGSQPPLRSAL
jgi:pimeloyl-ACP methyl ester carboxylesterase